MIKLLEIVEGELPYRIEFDELSGASVSPSGAVIVALSAGGKIPRGLRDRNAVAGYLLWHYEANPDWVKLIHILEKDTFDLKETNMCPDKRGGNRDYDMS